jgi:tetratricopeptide (TPR) repeat protein
MRAKETIRQAPAYKPTKTIVQRALAELKQDDVSLRDLVLKSAALREFDAELLGRLAEPEAEGKKLVGEIELYMPLERRGKDKYRYDQFTREALFEAIETEGEETLLRQALQEAIVYYERLASKKASEREKQRHKDQVLYYRLLADPVSGFKAWEQAWVEALKGARVLDRRAELIRLTEEAWSELSGVPGAQPTALVRKGWLAYDNGDWQVARSAFWEALTANAEPNPRERTRYLFSPATSSLYDGTVDRFLEARANLGLGYVNYRLGALAEAAQHFQRAIRLIGRKPPVEGQAALNRAKALCGLGEVCTRMGTPESILLRRRLLPQEEQRKTLVEYAQASEAPPLEDLALSRLLREAERLFEKALKTLEFLEESKPREETWEAVELEESVEGSRLRIQARQAVLFLQQGDWEGARVKFEEVRRRELAWLGADDERRALERLGADNGRSELLARDRRTVRRLGWINLHLGDCCLLATEIPAGLETDVPEDPVYSVAKQSPLARDLLERMAKRREAGPDDREPEVCDDQEAEARALAHYRTAKSLWKRINDREGQSLALRRQADVAALRPKDPKRRSEALHLYTTSFLRGWISRLKFCGPRRGLSCSSPGRGQRRKRTTRHRRQRWPSMLPRLIGRGRWRRKRSPQEMVHGQRSSGRLIRF